jgi:hypothetical protein
MANQIPKGGYVGGMKTLRMPQIAHLKEIKRGGTVNPASGTWPAGSTYRIQRKPRAGR